MSLSDLASLGSFVSGVAVLVSLVYLALQVRQAEKNQQAAIRQGRANAINEGNLTLVDSERAEGFWKIALGDEGMSVRDAMSAEFIFSMSFQLWEENFDQHSDGLLSDRAFQSVMRNVRVVIAYPGYRVAWRRQRPMYGVEFAGFMDKTMDEVPDMNSDLSLFDSVLSDIRAEKAKAVAA